MIFRHSTLRRVPASLFGGVLVIIAVGQIISAAIHIFNYLLHPGGPTFIQACLSGLNFFLSSLYGILGLMIVGVVNFTWIGISHAGLEYQGLGYRLSSRWSDVERIWRPWYFSWRIDLADFDHNEFLLLRKSKVDASYWPVWWLKLWGYTQRIPISEFTGNWRASKIGNSMRQYVPHLFDE